jgi:hypothetical protein
MSIASQLSGRVAVIEPEEFGALGWRYAAPVAGLVGDSDHGHLTIVGLAAPELVDGTEVMVSVFSPDALYRIRAGVRWVGSDRLAVDPIHDIEQIQRRRWPRHELQLDVVLFPAEGENLAPVPGRTMDIGMGGLRVEMPVPLPASSAVRVRLMLPDGTPLLAAATVVASHAHDGVFEYRLAFDQLDDLDTNNLAALLDPHAAAADLRRKAAIGPKSS